MLHPLKLLSPLLLSSILLSCSDFKSDEQERAEYEMQQQLLADSTAKAQEIKKMEDLENLIASLTDQNFLKYNYEAPGFYHHLWGYPIHPEQATIAGYVMDNNQVKMVSCLPHENSGMHDRVELLADSVVIFSSHDCYGQIQDLDDGTQMEYAEIEVDDAEKLGAAIAAHLKEVITVQTYVGTAPRESYTLDLQTIKALNDCYLLWKSKTELNDLLY